MSLLGHLWILSVLVVPLVQVSPEMIISVWFKDCSFFLWTILHNIHTTEFYSLQEKVYLQEGQGHQDPLLLHQNLFDPENVYFLHFNADFNPVCTKNNVKRGAYHFFFKLYLQSALGHLVLLSLLCLQDGPGLRLENIINNQEEHTENQHLKNC